MKRHISIFLLLFLAFSLKAQYSFQCISIDSLEKYNSFYTHIIANSNQLIVAEAGYTANWFRFKIDVNHGKHLGSGQIYFDRHKVYENNNELIITLSNYLGDVLDADTIIVPKPQTIRLNYLHDFPNVNERLKLDLGCIFNNGHAARVSQDPGFIWNDFTLTCRGDTFNPEFFFVPYFADSPEYVYVKATFNYDTSIWHGFNIPCTYSDTLHFDFSGTDGENGRNGQHGNSENAYGYDGDFGTNGGNGSDAINLNLVIIPLESENEVLLKVLLLSDWYQHYFFINPNKGKIKVDFDELDIDAMTISSHKIYGPQGIAALIVNKKIDIFP
ncbi:MAG: aminotransferase class V-fold PLP-dependent enzyme, partial [Bacteroidia bacterium]